MANKEDLMMKEPGQSADESYLVTPKQRRLATTKRSNAKFEEVRERLRMLAHAKGAGGQLPTIRELCTLLNTSTVTLTAALDFLETEKVLYRKERKGIFVADTIHQSCVHVVFNVAYLTELSESPFWTLLWGDLVQETEHRMVFKTEQYRFHLLCLSKGQTLPEQYADILNAPHVSGCLLIGVNARRPDHSRLLHVPHVVTAGGGDVIVGQDVVNKATLGTTALIEQGCQRIAFWMTRVLPDNEDVFAQGDEEIDTFAKVLKAYDLPIYPEYIRGAPTYPFSRKHILSYQEQGYVLVKDVFGSSRQERPDGIYISDDMMTAGALAAFEELGITVGQDIKIATMVNVGSPILFGRTKRMICVEFDPSDLVRGMFFQLDDVMSRPYTPEERTIKIRSRLRIYE